MYNPNIWEAEGEWSKSELGNKFQVILVVLKNKNKKPKQNPKPSKQTK